MNKARFRQAYVGMMITSLGLLAMPALASAGDRSGAVNPGTDCSWVGPMGGTHTVVVPLAGGPGPVVVYADADGFAGNGGMSTDADAVAGVCVNLAGNATGFEGGVLEAGVGSPVDPKDNAGKYVIADGDDNNCVVMLENCAGDPLSRGYAGLSNLESDADDGAGAGTDPGEKEDDCRPGAGDNAEESTNSGDCLTVRVGDDDLAAQQVPLLVCGNTSSGTAPDRRWENSRRDGCTLPQ